MPIIPGSVPGFAWVLGGIPTLARGAPMNGMKGIMLDPVRTFEIYFLPGNGSIGRIPPESANPGITGKL
jgi:hypothetical protein